MSTEDVQKKIVNTIALIAKKADSDDIHLQIIRGAITEVDPIMCYYKFSYNNHIFIAHSSLTDLSVGEIVYILFDGSEDGNVILCSQATKTGTKLLLNNIITQYYLSSSDKVEEIPTETSSQDTYQWQEAMPEITPERPQIWTRLKYIYSDNSIKYTSPEKGRSNQTLLTYVNNPDYLKEIENITKDVNDIIGVSDTELADLTKTNEEINSFVTKETTLNVSYLKDTAQKTFGSDTKLHQDDKSLDILINAKNKTSPIGIEDNVSTTENFHFNNDGLEISHQETINDSTEVSKESALYSEDGFKINKTEVNSSGESVETNYIDINTNESKLQTLNVVEKFRAGSHSVAMLTGKDSDGTTREGTAFYWVGDVK